MIAAMADVMASIQALAAAHAEMTDAGLFI
jgi:hypothetical protein